MKLSRIGLNIYLVFSISKRCSSDSLKEEESQRRVAIIGSGVGGSFTAKYLADYDSSCTLDITIFDASGLEGEQGSRVSSLTLENGATIELGASIIFGGNKLVQEMIDGDSKLKRTTPHSPGSNREIKTDQTARKGMGIFDDISDGGNPWALLVANMSSNEVKKTLMFRYNLDLWRINRATQSALSSFNMIYDLLDSRHESTFFDSPNDIWRATGLAYAASVSFNDLLDKIGVANLIPWWRHIFGHQGLVRSELYTAINLCNNNQSNDQISGLAGLVNSAATTGDLFAIDGGNDQLIASAIQQAQEKHDGVCRRKDTYNERKIRSIQKKIKTVVSDFESGMELFDSKGKSLGSYDVVVLAVPLQFSGITFLGKGSLFDSNVLHPLSLNGMVDSEDSDANVHEHKGAYGRHLPTSASRPYTQVVTSIIFGDLNATHFYLDEDNIPKSIYFTEKGKKQQMGLSSISQIFGNVYKVFSSEVLSEESVAILFGDTAKVEYTKIWDKGATPAFNGGKESTYSTQFLLYDGGHGSGSLSDDSASLYYVNSMEAAVSAIEISAIGSKFVSKLIARRLGLINSTVEIVEDEL